jgi:hypothetical protein
MDSLQSRKHVLEKELTEINQDDIQTGVNHILTPLCEKSAIYTLIGYPLNPGYRAVVLLSGIVKIKIACKTPKKTNPPKSPSNTMVLGCGSLQFECHLG